MTTTLMHTRKRKTADKEARHTRARTRIAGGMLLLGSASALYFAAPLVSTDTYQRDDALAVPAEVRTPSSGAPERAPEPVAHISTPPSVKAIYMTSCVAGTPSFRERLVGLIERTEINAIVIDIKDYTGMLSYVPEDPALSGSVSKRCGAPDMREFIKELHEKGIYVIGRVTVFQDPHLVSLRPDLAVKKRSDGSVWEDFKGLNFTDPGAREVWEYHAAIAKDAYRIGFDEINFDYIRFPSDGNMKDIAFPHSEKTIAEYGKARVLYDFFKYLSEELRPAGIVISADLFGMTTTNTDDLNIGQIIEYAYPFFDYVAPMVYPSHYPRGFNGWANPNDYQQLVVFLSWERAVRRAAATTTPIVIPGTTSLSTSTPMYPKESYGPDKLRPWLQDFDYGGNYDADAVRTQIQATYDTGITSWMLWDPGNTYTEEALTPLHNPPPLE